MYLLCRHLDKHANPGILYNTDVQGCRKMSAFETEARVIEITKLARNAAQVALLRAHLEEVTHGEDLFASPRGQQFLRHVVEKAIQGDFDSLKERVIGIELFHR